MKPFSLRLPSIFPGHLAVLVVLAISMFMPGPARAQVRQVLDPGDHPTPMPARPPIRAALSSRTSATPSLATAGAGAAIVTTARAAAPLTIRAGNPVVHPDGLRITPLISWPTPDPINYGVGLSSNQLDATAEDPDGDLAPVPGTYTYSPAAGTVLAPGNQTLNVTFTPNDTTTYTTATATVTQVVTNTPAIFWDTPAAIAYGTPLSGNQLNAQAYPNGTFSYSPAAGTILPIGKTTITVTFTPANPNNFTSNTATVVQTVTNMVAINWPTPAPVVVGTALSATQENATSYNNIPGTFAYSPTLGTVFPVGNNPLTVTFTPTDTRTYAANTASVPLAVYKAPAIAATNTTITPSASAVGTGQVLTLTSTTTQDGTPVTGGTVTFYDTGQFADELVQVGTARIVGNNATNGLQPGQASIHLRVGPGNHAFSASFANTAAYQASTSSSTQVTVVGTEPSSLVLTAKADTTTPANYDFLAAISGFGHELPGGTVTFTDQTTGATLGTTPIYEEFSNFNFSVISTPTPTQATGIATADVNNDGAQDLVVVTYDSAFITLSVSVSLGNGDGTYQDAVSYTIDSDPTNTYSPTGGTTGYFNAVAVADLNGDGYPDIVVTDSNGGNIDVLINKGDGTFKTPVAYGTGNDSDTAPFPNGTFPQGVSLGDLNGDGILDAVVGNNGPGTIAVMLGSGDGGFNASTEYQGGGGNQFAIADFAGTGNLGVAASSGYGSLPVFLGNGDGSLQAPTFVPIGTRTIGVVAADFNGDNTPDLAVLDQVGNTVSIALGKGDGSFQAATAYATSGDPVSLVAADFNADGTPDIAVANYVGTGTHTQGGTISNLSLLLGKGDGTLQPQTIYPIGSTALSATDLNGDGVVDLADAGQSAVTIVLGGTALSAGLENIAIPGTGAQTILATYNPSSSSIYTTSSQTVSVTGNGSAAPVAPGFFWPTPASIPYGTPLSGAQLNAEASVQGTFVYTPAAGTILPIGSNTLSVTFTPFDTTDYTSVTQTVTLVVTNMVAITWPPPAQITEGTPLSSTQLDATAYVPGTFVYSPAAGTVLPVGNNTLNVTFTPTDTATYAVTQGSTTLGVAKAAATTATTTSLTVSATTATTGQILTLQSSTVVTSTRAVVGGGTINFLDGKVLIGMAQIVGTNAAAGFTAGQATLKTALGPGTHSITAQFSGTGAVEPSTSTAASVTVTGTEQSAIALTAAADTATPANYDFTAVISGFGHAAPGGTVTFTDLTSNLVLGTEPLVNAAAQFNFSVQTSAVPTEGTTVATADLNADGLQDLVVLNYGADYTTLNATVYLGKGDGTFRAPTNYLIGTDTTDPEGYGVDVGGFFNGLAVTDLNADGIPDIVVTDSNYNNVAVLVGIGDGTFAAPVTYNTSQNTDSSSFPQNVSVGDMNGDGIPDLVVGNSDHDALAVLLGNGDATFQTAVEYSAGSLQIGYVNIRLADVKGNGILGAFTGGLLFLGNGDGSLQSPTVTINEDDPSAVVTGDFNGDGKLDLAVTSQDLSTVAVALGNGDGTFQAYTSYNTDDDPTSLVIADVNADGMPDLIVASYLGSDGIPADSDLGLLIGKGDGTFQQQTTFPIGSTSLAATDFNGDGVIDVADAGQAAVNIVLGGTALTAQLNNIPIAGAGSHTIQAAYAPATGSIYTASTKTVTITGNGTVPTLTLTWPTPASIVYGTPLSATQLDATASVAGAFVYTPAAGAILQAGTQTLSVTFTPTDTVDYSPVTQTVTLVVTKATPVLTWATPAAVPAGTALSATQLDASVTIPGTFVYSPSAGATPPVGDTTLTATFTPTDAIDYATATASVVLGVLTPGPIADTATSIALSPATATTAQVVTITASTVLMSDTIPVTGGAISFYDGNTLLGTVGIAGTTPATGFTTGAATLKTRFGPGTHTLTAHFNGTGNDVLSVSPPAVLTVSGTEGSTVTVTAKPNTGTPANYDFTAIVAGLGYAAPGGTVNFTDPTTNTALGSQTLTGATGTYSFTAEPAPGFTDSVANAIVDVNGDGIPDLVAEYYSNTFANLNVAVSLGMGDGTFATPTSYSIGSGGGGFGVNGITAADLNQDGLPDIVATNVSAGGVVVLLNTGGGNFATPVPYGFEGDPQSLAVGDVNGDGIPDVVSANYGSIVVLLGNGDGTLGTATSYRSQGNDGGIVLGAFSGGGRLDALVLSNQSNAAVSLVPGNGDGSFQTARQIAVGNTPSSIVAGDFNGDSKLDAAVTNSADGTISVLLGNGDGTFAPQVTYTVGTAPVSIVATDVNGDGKLDLLVANGTSQTISVLIGQGDGTFVVQASLTVPGVGYLAAGDLNGDGIADISSSEQTPLVLLGGTSLTAQLTNVALPVAGTQRIQAAFVPATNSIYTGSIGTVTVTGNGSSTAETFTWATPAPVPFGTALSATELDAVASVAGTIVYTPAAGTMLSVGSHTLSATFTPTDTIDYTVLTQTVTLVVTQATPVITWPTPAPIGVGAALTSAQLDATANVPGTLVYTPPAGTVPPAGNDTLSVTFTPTDTVDYTTATATVNLAVTGGAAGAVLSGPLTSNPGTQPQVTLTLTQPYPIDLVATFTLSVQPATAGGVVDPAIQFAGGGTTYVYTIPAGSTTVPPVLFSAGTVASTITVTVTFTAAGVNVTPTTLQPLVVQVPAAAPVVASATLVRSGKVLTVVVQGSSSTRDVVQAAFTFKPATGQTVSDATITVPVTPDFATWYQNTVSDAFGSGFLYTQQFLLSNDAAAIGSVTVTLTNAIGASNVETAQ